MKKVFLTIILIVFCLSNMNAQKDVTTFLGIPVDGYKPAMIQKLKAKGFTYKQVDDTFTGEFNGTNVRLHVVTNNNKVYRIMLVDETHQDEANIKIRFNKLVSQFNNNKRYTSFGNQTIADDDDISYEMTVNKKIYEAIFYQIVDTEKLDSVEFRKKMIEKLSYKYTKEQIDNPTEDIVTEMKMAAVEQYADMVTKKPVWFRINEYYGKYYIVMYYDNEWNHADGEDL